MKWIEYLHRLYFLWMRFGEYLGRVISIFWLTVFYLLIIFPIGLIWRLNGHDPLKRKWQKEKMSYREDSDPIDFTHMEYPF